MYASVTLGITITHSSYLMSLSYEVDEICWLVYVVISNSLSSLSSAL